MGGPDRSEITPEYLYLSRRRFIVGVGATVASLVLLGGCDAHEEPATSPLEDACRNARARAATDEIGNRLTDCETIHSFNNFYEFTPDKAGVSELARAFRTSPWTVEVGGLVHEPRAFSVQELQKRYPQEERVYRMRCVETWSMVIPWLGFSLRDLLRDVGSAPGAKYVRFETLHDPEQMPGQRQQTYSWPYAEGLRFDEAMHPLTILATGIYGRPLLPQDGAPIRLVVPWKYGFKSIKSIVRIDLVEEMPVSFWMKASPDEYGFYANVNPDLPHPRWSQAREQRIGEPGLCPTLYLNGYADEVAHLYQGMDPAELY